MEYNRNFFIAIALSFAVIFGWQYFYVGPKNADLQKAQEMAQKAQSQKHEESAVPQAPAASGNRPSQHESQQDLSSAAGGDAGSAQARNAQLGDGQRVEIETPELKGSINLVGAQFDDLLLKKYHLTVDNDSPEISLLSPNGSKQAYLAEFGFVDKGGNGVQVPQSNTPWHLEGANQKLTPTTPVTLAYTNDQGLTFHRQISVDEHYMFRIADTISNNSGESVKLSSYARVTRAAPPEHESATYLLHEGMIGVIGDNGLETEKYSALEDLKPNEKNQKKIDFAAATGGWIGITDKYWAVAAIPPQDKKFASRFVYFDNLTTHFQSDLMGEAVSIGAGETKSLTNQLFAGAKQVEVINHYQDQFQIKQLELLIDWGMFHFITKPMFSLIDFLYKLSGNFGIAIVLVTVLLKALLFPLANKSYKSMARMKVVQPAMMEIRKKYADDRVKQQQATMELYKSEKINPLAGCWPILIQMPIFFALYKVLYITIEMRHAPFFGWIQDLAAPDPTSLFNLFGLLPYAVPTVLMIGAWPLLMGATMFLQMRMNPTPAEPTQAMVFTWMPVVFTFMLASFPAGLVIYWAWNNTLSILQQAIIMKKQGAKIELWDNLKALFKAKQQKETQ